MDAKLTVVNPLTCFHGDVEIVGEGPDDSAIFHCLWCDDYWPESED